MIRALALTKRYGTTVAVDGADFTVQAGRVTALLGPNGAGKSTMMRLALGLDRPSAGAVTVNGRPYRELKAPLREVGALLGSADRYGSRSAYNHLLCLARSNGIPRRRVDEVITMVGLEQVAGRPAGRFSLGMAQRLGVAAALLGDPGVLMLDEPTNGLDPDGVLWVRSLLRRLAADGRTVFMTSQAVAETAMFAEHLMVMGRGRVLADTSMRRFVAENATSHVRVRSPQVCELAPALAQRGWKIGVEADRSLLVYGAGLREVGDCAWEIGAHLHELTMVRPSLEAAFLRLTGDSAEFRAKPPGRGAAPSGLAGSVPDRPGSARPGLGRRAASTGISTRPASAGPYGPSSRRARGGPR